MTTDVTGASPARHTGRRVAVGLLGVAALALGVVLLFDPVAAARTLALLLGLSLVIGGLLEIAVGWGARVGYSTDEQRDLLEMLGLTDYRSQVRPR